MGTNLLKGEIHSGVPFNQIDSKIEYLKAQPKLNSLETAQVKYWQGYKNRMQNGDGYLQMMAQTTLGGQYTQDYNMTQVVLNNGLQAAQKSGD